MFRLEKLKDLLLSGVLLSEDTFAISDIDTILDNRDLNVFDTEWVRNYSLIKQNGDPEAGELIDSIREIAYRITFDATESPDLAGYISDDFGLIAQAMAIKYNDSWLNALAKEYTERRIPNNILTPIDGELDRIILRN